MKMNFKNIKKSAFTIAEIVVCFGIMALIFTATLTNVVRNDNYYKLYWTAFNTLFQAAHNAQAAFSGTISCTCNNGEACYSYACWNQEVEGQRTEILLPGGTKHTREWPDFLYGYSGVTNYDGIGTDKAFCEELTSQINTLFSSNECNSFISSINPSRAGDVKSKGVKFSEAFSSEGLDGIEPSFVAANGQKFYISSTATANAMHNVFGNEQQRKTFRFVAVDLNGSASPNTQFRTNGRFPDIVLFAITSRGDVIPLGLPEFYKSYINAVVQYPEFLNKRDPNDPDRFLRNEVQESEHMTLFDARKHAWGPALGQVDATIYGQGYNADEPLSYSSVFYNNAATCKTGCISSSKDERYVDELYSQIVMQFLYNEEGSSEILPQLLSRNDTPVAEDKGCSFGSSPCRIVFMHD